MQAERTCERCGGRFRPRQAPGPKNPKRYCSHRCSGLAKSAVGPDGPPWTLNERGCWIWDLKLNHGGYPRISSGRLAHRWLYEIVVGPIPDGYELDHLCRNRACVNPDHLEAVTRAEHARRRLDFIRTPEFVAMVQESPVSNRILAARLGVGISTIKRARRG
jgi:hypothetical protein